MSVEAPVATVVADGGRGGFTRPALAVDIEAAEEADGGGVPEPGTELGALDDARLAELSGQADATQVTRTTADATAADATQVTRTTSVRVESHRASNRQQAWLSSGRSGHTLRSVGRRTRSDSVPRR